MTRRQVWQYWCDHCGKHNLSAASIAKHEKHCTKNPARVCRMCKASGGEQLSIEELSACIDISLPDEGLQWLRDARPGTAQHACWLRFSSVAHTGPDTR